MPDVNLGEVPPTRKWSVAGFEYFWSKARDPRMVATVVWPDVTGRWPCSAGPVVGRKAYMTAISNFLDALQDFDIEVTDQAIDGDTAFLRWVIRGKFIVGPNEIVGVDRLLLEDGYVRDNHIHSDHPLFAKLAEVRALG